MWTAVDAVLDELVDAGLERRADVLRDHRVHLLAARRAQARGIAVPSMLQDAQRLAAIVAVSVPRVLERVRAACDGPVLLIKGAEVAARYPDPLSRPYIDVDLLTPDAHAAQRALVAAGFGALGAADSAHHLAPLHLPGLPVRVEVHAALHWPDGLAAPPVAELLDTSVPSALGVEGIAAPAPAHHAVLLAAHAWTDRPLGRLGRLVDVEALSLEAGAAELDALARAWGCARLWRATRRAAESVLLGRRATLPLRVWARHLPEVRSRTVLGVHLERWLAPASAFPAHQVVARAASAVAHDMRPHPGEGWGTKATRVRRAVAHADRPESEHLAALGPRSERSRVAAPR
jgi:hypothetical protein